jgi:hypothetical protein
LLSIAELGVDARRGAWNGFPTELKEMWLQRYSKFYNPELIAWFEANINNP